MKLFANIQELLSTYSPTTNTAGEIFSPTVSSIPSLTMVVPDEETTGSHIVSSSTSNDEFSLAPAYSLSDCDDIVDRTDGHLSSTLLKNDGENHENALIANDDQQPCSSSDRIEMGLEAASCLGADSGSISYSDDSEQLPKRSVNGKCVHFPVDDELVSQWVEPLKPLFVQRRILAEANDATNFLNVHEILQSYLNACKKFKVSPSSSVEKQISRFHLVESERQDMFCLRGDKVTAAHMDCLEEIFKRVQFARLDFEYCFLDDEAITALCDMLEFYDSALKLNLSFNQHVTFRGWQAICRMLKKSPCLEQLDLRYTSLNERSVPLLSRTLRAPDLSLTSLHLENCSLSGKSMLLLACAMKVNTSIRDLYLADNNLLPTDAAHLYQIIVHNSTLELLDLRNNSVQDAGFAHICDALKHTDCQAQSKLNSLILWNIKLTAHGMIHLIRVLLENKTLRTLNLGRNDICSEGVALIKEALARNSTLLRLGFQATKLNCQGAIALAESIADNASLIRVDLRANPEIKSAGLLALHVAMRLNRTITSLNLDETCALLPPTHPKQLSSNNNHAEHFRKLFDEIAAFCHRNCVAYVKRLKSRRREDADDDAEKSSDASVGGSGDVVSISGDAGEPTATDVASERDGGINFNAKIGAGGNATKDVVENGDVVGVKAVAPSDMLHGSAAEADRDGPTKLNFPLDADIQAVQEIASPDENMPVNVEYFYEYNNPSKKCVRRVSLTCKELVDNLRERFEKMPRFQEVTELTEHERDWSPADNDAASSANQNSSASAVNHKSVTSSTNHNSVTSSVNQNSLTSSANQNSVTSSANQNSLMSSANQYSVTSSANQNLSTSSANQYSVTSSANQNSVTSSSCDDLNHTRPQSTPPIAIVPSHDSLLGHVPHERPVCLSLPLIGPSTASPRRLNRFSVIKVVKPATTLADQSATSRWVEPNTNNQPPSSKNHAIQPKTTGDLEKRAESAVEQPIRIEHCSTMAHFEEQRTSPRELNVFAVTGASPTHKVAMDAPKRSSRENWPLDYDSLIQISQSSNRIEASKPSSHDETKDKSVVGVPVKQLTNHDRLLDGLVDAITTPFAERTGEADQNTRLESTDHNTRLESTNRRSTLESTNHNLRLESANHILRLESANHNSRLESSNHNSKPEPQWIFDWVELTRHYTTSHKFKSMTSSTSSTRIFDQNLELKNENADPSRQNGCRIYNDNDSDNDNAQGNSSRCIERPGELTLSVSCKLNDKEIAQSVSGALRDILNYCDYATSKVSLTPPYPVNRLSSPVETPASSLDDNEIVESLLNDLVCYVDYEVNSPDNLQKCNFESKISSLKSTAQRTEPAVVNLNRNIGATVYEQSDDMEVHLSVRRTVRALVKKVSLIVDRKVDSAGSTVGQNKPKLLNKFSACRSSVALRKKALQKR